MRFCVKDEKRLIKDKRPEPPIRKLIPKLLDQHKLLDRQPGAKAPDDDWSMS